MKKLWVLSLSLFFAPHLVRAADATGVVISEFMTANGSTVLDEDGSYSDWIELLNASSQPVNLAGYYLTDSEKTLPKWQFPDVTIDPGRFLVVFASGKDRARPGKELHTSFKLDPDGQFLGLV